MHCLYALLMLTLVAEVACHGRLRHPPARSTKWRDNWPTEPNYDDNSLFCGGFDIQWNQNGGRCGLCGDNYYGPREHEWGGKYMKGIVVEHYRVGQQIDVVIELTANHRGWFEFKLCEFDTLANPATQACLDNHVLQLAQNSGSGTKFLVDTWRSGNWNVSLILPANVLCDKCMLQWRYHAGNSYGVDSNGVGCMGCGPQEEFYGCTDVRITTLGGSIQRPPTATTTTAGPTTTVHPIYCADGLYISSEVYNSASMDAWCMSTCTVQDCPSSHCRCQTPLAPGETMGTRPTTTTTTTTTTEAPDSLVCSDGLYEPTPVYQAADNMYPWCKMMCDLGYCYRTHCQCVNPSAEV